VTGDTTRLSIDDLVVRYGGPDGWWRGLSRKPGFLAVDEVSLRIPAGQTLGLVGGSGCGKSTIAKVIAGLQKPTSGVVQLDDRVLPERRSKADARLVQMVFQDPSSALNPRLTVRQTLTELLRTHGLATGTATARRIAELLELVGLSQRVLDVRPRRLSGGQRQRVGIARALAVEPSVLIADEAVSALDVSVQAAVLNTLQRLKRDLGLTMLFISHDLAVTRYISDSVAVMQAGRIVERGTPEVVLSNPQHPYTRALVAASPRHDQIASLSNEGVNT
jgi:ABC-type glutathione transport system ATPase component